MKNKKPEQNPEQSLKAPVKPTLTTVPPDMIALQTMASGNSRELSQPSSTYDAHALAKLRFDPYQPISTYI